MASDKILASKRWVCADETIPISVSKLISIVGKVNIFKLCASFADGEKSGFGNLSNGLCDLLFLLSFF